MNTGHIQKSYDEGIKAIKNRIVLMAEMVSNELEATITAFAERDKTQAVESAAADELVNASERIIDQLVIETVVRHQPVASDLRELVVALRISKELERIGDYAKNIAFHSTTLDDLEVTGEEQRLIDLGHAVNTMLVEVIQAYQDRDTKMAQTIREQDVDIDKLYSKIFADLLTIATYNGEFAPACTHLSFVGRSLERIADHVTDIAEDILYLVQGEYPADDREKADDSAFISV